MKRVFLFIFPLFLFGLGGGSGCTNVSATKNGIKQASVMTRNNNEIKFSEVRRLNKNIPLKEYTVLQSFEEIVKLYSTMEDKRFSRSQPIPTLSENEFLLVLKPQLKKQPYGDIEIVRMEEEQSVLNVYYKEIDNEEYLLNKEKNPILILKIEGKIPSGVKLINS
ncbi:hypothetical protein B0A69_07555 [Chryseobacterium shigense]|uniref:Lipoprotein n=1 Tax=Chryseobacterium shigense TaxID=297244 RepID=A0A1N7I665_9FLAO|nr:hypothetical protein [Chryseobacterium shigense]PQA95288.1 hypothetical protein B0A69_07555 [Chryseobacterium shigense]SIS32559.1 hypothetical protein SAMN05421639_102284 [Chryseobacterium shigense]